MYQILPSATGAAGLPATLEIALPTAGGNSSTLVTVAFAKFADARLPVNQSVASTLPEVRTLLANPLVLAPIYPSYIGKYLTVISAPLVGAVINDNVVPEIV